MRRDDLFALTPEALAALANVGLVKRAQRELAAGQGPSLVVEADGTVVGTFADGVVARLELGRRLDASRCTCPATGVCRHRVSVVLAYREQEAAAAPALVTAPVTTPASPATEPVDDLLRRHLGARLVDAARALVARGLIVTVEGDTVHLPTCTVRFLVGDAPEYARCDCAAAAACEHIAIASWARRAQPSGTFEMGDEGRRVTFEVDRPLMLDLESLVARIIDGGVTQPLEPLAERFAALRQRAAPATWIVTLLDDLQQQLEAYARRSARYDEAELVRLLAELAARARAARHPAAELPARYVLGVGEAEETQLDQLRLVSLGARLLADGTERTAHVYLADPDTSSVLVLSKVWTFAAGESPLAGPGLAHRNIVTGIPLGLLARGQLVTRSARRRANLSLELGARKGATAMLPGAVDLSSLPATLYVRVYSELVARLQRRPPRALRPRVLADSMVALAVAGTSSVAYMPSTQTLQAQVHDASGDIAWVELTHRSVAPHALDALAAGLSSSPRAIVGRARLGVAGLCIEPVAVDSGKGFVVLDLAEAVESPTLPRSIANRATDALEESLASALGDLAWLAHHGLHRSAHEGAARLQRQAARCESVGLVRFAERLGVLAAQPTHLRWVDAAIWHGLECA